MAYQNDASKKYCSTCEYWTGSREISRSENMYYIKHNGTARCELNAMGGCNMSGNQNTNGCRKYKKWNHLP